jgi:hypothetical protein
VNVILKGYERSNRAWTGFMWQRIETNVYAVICIIETFGFYKMREVSLLAEKLLANKRGLCSL